MKRMKKFIILIMMLTLTLLPLTGCSNMSLGIGNYNFKKVHISTPRRC